MRLAAAAMYEQDMKPVRVAHERGISCDDSADGNARRFTASSWLHPSVLRSASRWTDPAAFAGLAPGEAVPGDAGSEAHRHGVLAWLPFVLR